MAQCEVQASAPERLSNMLEQKLESVFAAPNSIIELQNSLRNICDVMPLDTHISANLRCNEQKALLTLTYNQPLFNPLILLPELPVDSTDYSTDNERSTLKLSKSL